MGDISLASVTSGYGSMHILREIDLAIAAGERVALLGRNGAGKTTLLLTMMGRCQLHSGTISFAGEKINTLPTWRRARTGLGLVPQTRDVFPSLSVEENLVAGLKSSREADIGEAYALFPRLRERRTNLAGQLSGGEQQMLAIARTLLGKPTVLLLDEPLEGLAPIICQELMQAFGTLADSRTGLTIMLVEQHVRVALAFARRAVVLDQGRIVFDDEAEKLKQSNVLDRSLGLNLMPGKTA